MIYTPHHIKGNTLALWYKLALFANHTLQVSCTTCATNTHCSQELRHHFDLLSSGEEVGEGNSRHTSHLHVVDDTHELGQQPQREECILHAVDCKAAASVFIAILRTTVENTQL